MQRDLKIGISLCVLMFGVVGALMFRREQPANKTQALQLKTAKQLDQKIAQRSRTPYMTGMTGEIEQDEESDAANQEARDGSRPSHLLPPNHLLDEDDGILAPPQPGGRSSHSTNGIVPLRPRGESTPRIVTEGVIPGLQTHTIQSGDTLSSLAEKYLGSQKRFQEIFDANRTVLTSPNRLPEGVVISIPPAVKEVRRTADQKSTGSPVSHETRRPNEELTEFTPIAPGPGQTVEPTHPKTAQTASDHDKVETTTDDAKTAELKSSETKKRFFAPSRLPFTNHVTPRTAPSRKILDPDGETIAEPKDKPGTDPAHGGEKQVYHVRKGDSLERISQKVYGNSKRAPDIFNANRSKLASPDAVREGLELDLP